LQVAGVHDEAIAQDYALTRVGREPVREMVMARLASMPFFASNNQAALNMFTCRYVSTHRFNKSLTSSQIRDDDGLS
jgi:hypothetical protein